MGDGQSLLNADAAGKLLGVGGRQVRNMISAGILPAEKIGRDYVIRREDLEKIPKTRKRGPKPRETGPANAKDLLK